MKPIDTEVLARRALLAAGLDFSHPDPAVAWEVFKQLAALPVECSRDYLFFQAADGDERNGASGYFGFVREFEMRGESGDEPVWFEQLHIEFQPLPSHPLGIETVVRFSLDYTSREEFFAAVEQLPQFRAGIGYAGATLSVYHTGV